MYASHGEAAKVLELRERPLSPPGNGEVRIRLVAAVIHPSDLGMIGGVYGKLPPLPAVAGREGVAEVVALGAGVQNLTVGERVRFPESLGTWQTQANVAAADLWRVPAGLPDEAAAQAWINPPTAWRLLRDAHLTAGQWVVQNAANSAVGVCVIQMARHLGLKTLNIVRRAELVGPLKALGADVVVTEDSGYEKKVGELTGSGEVLLALNSVGGESAIRLVRALSNGGTHITFGGASFEAVRFPTRNLIFHDICMKGFWLDRWYRTQSKERVQIMLDRVYPLLRDGTVKLPVAGKFRLQDYSQALETAAQPRLGKVLLVG